MEENDQFLEISLLSRSWSWQVSPSYSVCDGAATLSNITGKFCVKGKKSHCQMFRCQLLNNDFLSLLWGCLKFVVSFRLLLHELLHVWVYVQVAAFWWVDPHSQNLHSKFWKVFFFPRNEPEGHRFTEKVCLASSSHEWTPRIQGCLSKVY